VDRLSSQHVIRGFCAVHKLHDPLHQQWNEIMEDPIFPKTWADCYKPSSGIAVDVDMTERVCQTANQERHYNA
jgi:hypothetical protein